ncbi:outer membrane beta-barrel protein, partial [Flavobacterium sp. ST-87]
MKFNIKNAIGITAFLISQGIAAQFYVGVQAGIGDIKNDTKVTAPGYKIEHSGALKVGYIYSLTNHFGIGTGVEFSQYKQDVYLKNATQTLTNFEIDPSTSAFVYNVTTSNYSEKQTLQAIQIPLFLQYKTNISKGVD